MKTLGLLLLLFCLPAFAKDHPIQTAKVLSQNVGERDGGTAVIPFGTGLYGVPITSRSNVVVVETQHHRLTWQEVGGKTLILPVNETINFYYDGKYFVVMDARNKKHKFAMIHMESLN